MTISGDAYARAFCGGIRKCGDDLIALLVIRRVALISTTSKKLVSAVNAHRNKTTHPK